MATIPGTPVADDLSSSTAGDVILGLGGNDVLAANAANITLDGGLGDDQLFSFTGGNTLIGGQGDDQLFSGGTNDVFKYSFTPASGQGSTSTFTDWLSDKYGKDFGDELPDFSPKHHNKHDKHDKDDRDGHHGKNDKHDNHGKDDKHGKDDGHHSKGDHCGNDGHHAQDGGLTEKFFENNYQEWLKEVVVADLLEQGFVLDANGNGKIKIDINEDSPDGTPRIEGLTQEQLAEIFGDRDSVILRDGHKAEEAFYSNSYTSPGGGQGTVASMDGFDTILGFDFAEDKLDFSGVTQQQFLDFFNVDFSQDRDGDNVADTFITIKDFTDWSVTLSGVFGHGLEDFANDSIFS